MSELPINDLRTLRAELLRVAASALAAEAAAARLLGRRHDATTWTGRAASAAQGALEALDAAATTTTTRGQR